MVESNNFVYLVESSQTSIHSEEFLSSERSQLGAQPSPEFEIESFRIYNWDFAGSTISITNYHVLKQL